MCKYSFILLIDYLFIYLFSLYFCLMLSVSLSLSVFLCLFPSFSLLFSLSLSLWPYLSLALSLFCTVMLCLCLSLSPSVALSPCLTLSPSLSLCLLAPLFLSVSPPRCLSLTPSVFLSVSHSRRLIFCPSPSLSPPLSFSFFLPRSLFLSVSHSPHLSFCLSHSLHLCFTLSLTILHPSFCLSLTLSSLPLPHFLHLYFCLSYSLHLSFCLSLTRSSLSVRLLFSPPPLLPVSHSVSPSLTVWCLSRSPSLPLSFSFTRSLALDVSRSVCSLSHSLHLSPEPMRSWWGNRRVVGGSPGPAGSSLSLPFFRSCGSDGEELLHGSIHSHTPLAHQRLCRYAHISNACVCMHVCMYVRVAHYSLHHTRPLLVIVPSSIAQRRSFSLSEIFFLSRHLSSPLLCLAIRV